MANRVYVLGKYPIIMHYTRFTKLKTNIHIVSTDYIYRQPEY